MCRKTYTTKRGAGQNFDLILKGSLSNDSDVMCISFFIIHSWILFVELKNQSLLIN